MRFAFAVITLCVLTVASAPTRAASEKSWHVKDDAPKQLAGLAEHGEERRKVLLSEMASFIRDLSAAAQRGDREAKRTIGGEVARLKAIVDDVSKRDVFPYSHNRQVSLLSVGFVGRCDWNARLIQVVDKDNAIVMAWSQRILPDPVNYIEIPAEERLVWITGVDTSSWTDADNPPVTVSKFIIVESNETYKTATGSKTVLKIRPFDPKCLFWE